MIEKSDICDPLIATFADMSIVEMKVPTIGESITEVTLSEWLKADGDYVNLG